MIFEIIWNEIFHRLTLARLYSRLQKNSDIAKLMVFREFMINIFMNIGFTQNLQHPVFYLKSELINWFIKLPQMKSDYLLKHKILVVSPIEKMNAESKAANEGMAKKHKEYLSYLELCTASLNHQINLQNIKNIWRQLKHINFRLNLNSLWIVFQKETVLDDDQENPQIKGLQALIDNLSFSTLLYQKPVG